VNSLILSVVTPTLNSEKTIRRFLESFPPILNDLIEIIIVDGGSKDGTLQILKEFEKSLNINYKSEKDAGIYDAMNKGASRCTGNYLLFINSDDWIESQSLTELTNLLQNTNFDVYTFMQKRWLSRDKFMVDFPDLKSSVNGTFPHQCLIISKEVFNRCGPYLPSYKICADYDFILRMLFQNFTTIRHPLVVSNYSTSGFSSKISNLPTYYLEVLSIWKKYSVLTFRKFLLFTLRTLLLLLKKLFQSFFRP
jgi:glycosyltransferase involved in cell wall biosynthesis